MDALAAPLNISGKPATAGSGPNAHQWAAEAKGADDGSQIEWGRSPAKPVFRK
jgi:hypothetical protein